MGTEAGSFAKQDPAGKRSRALAGGKCYFSYSQIAATVSSAVPAVEAFAPDVFVAIGGGGFVRAPASIQGPASPARACA